ncbi:GNAT family N-acetyltransferase [Marinicella rhabdoformis]|uniref:GNAT family N-acetyltransferase n=1 Tax=Marinicella rhabdoformis TaxID=2580566 RepID=UPI0012AEDEBB|nr:GNAT family N-acetyltransferase [Marinicella rhabdoformis]
MNHKSTIQIRHSEPEDIPAIKALYAEPSCYAGTLQQPFASEQMWQNRLKEPQANFISLVAIGGYEDGEELLGQLGMEIFTHPRRKHVANMGMAVSEQHRNQGVARTLLASAIDTAENWQAVTRIELEVYTDNPAALKLYQNHGFEIEGRAKNYAYRSGEYVDVYLMARIT